MHHVPGVEVRDDGVDEMKYEDVQLLVPGHLHVKLRQGVQVPFEASLQMLYCEEVFRTVTRNPFLKTMKVLST